MTPLNADLGEGAAHDAELMPLIRAANVGCGRHAGDALTARAALKLAARHGVEVGAHPGYPDRATFGRAELGWDAETAGANLLMQVGGLIALARAVPVAVTFLKPHGALYHRANADPTMAGVVAAVALLTGLDLVGLPGSELARAAAKLNVPYRREGFADRRYAPDGTLVPRDQPDALIRDPAEAAEQARRLAGGIDTLCVHGDTPGALAFARELAARLGCASGVGFA